MFFAGKVLAPRHHLGSALLPRRSQGSLDTTSPFETYLLAQRYDIAPPSPSTAGTSTHAGIRDTEPAMASHERGAHGAEPPKPSGSATHASRGWAQRGWLEKKEGVTATWSRHWFQVEGSELHFYDAERAQGGSRLGHIDLEKVTIDHSTAVTADVGEIEIKASTRTHRIQCGTDVEAEEWIEALNAAKDGRVLERPARSSSRPARSASLGRTASSSGRRPGGKAPKHPWTQEEDEKLVSLIIQHGANHWAKIAQQIPGRVGKQCRERWQNHLNPDVNRAAEWSEEEEQALFKWHEILGNKWADIAKHLPGRTDNSVKNYFHKRVGQLKRGAPASRPKKSIEKSFSKPSGPNRALVAELVRALTSSSSSSSYPPWSLLRSACTAARTPV